MVVDFVVDRPEAARGGGASLRADAARLSAAHQQLSSSKDGAVTLHHEPWYSVEPKEGRRARTGQLKKAGVR